MSGYCLRYGNSINENQLCNGEASWGDITFIQAKSQEKKTLSARLLLSRHKIYLFGAC